MSLCFSCQRELDTIDTDGAERWHYRTITEQCDRCGDDFSHEQVLPPVSDKLP